MAYLPSLCPKLLCGQCRRSKVPTRVLTGSSTPQTSIGSQDIQLILNIEARGHDKAQRGSEITLSDNASAVHAPSSWSEIFVRIFPLIVTQVDPSVDTMKCGVLSWVGGLLSQLKTLFISRFVSALARDRM